MTDKMGLLVTYGAILGLSPTEMAEIALEAQSAVEEFEAGGVAECVLAASCGCDPKILWLGAVVYGYIIDTCTVVDKELEEVPQ